jgi:hypothetical protein
MDFIGSAGAVQNLAPGAGHQRRPSSSSDGSKHGLLSSGEEEFFAEETKATIYKPVSIRQIHVYKIVF